MGLFVFINSGLFVLFWMRSPSLQLLITEHDALIPLQLLCVSYERSQFDTETLCFEWTPPMFLWLTRIHCVSGLATGSSSVPYPVGGNQSSGSLVEPGSTSTTELGHPVPVPAEAMLPPPPPTPL